MYKGTIWAASLLLAASFTADVFAQTDMTQNIPHTETPPVIDGIVDDIYPTEGDGVFPMLNGRGGYEAGVDELNSSGTAYALWDADNLYIIAVVTDDVLIADETDPGNAWNDDSIELYIDGLNDKCGSCYDANDTQYRFRPGIEGGEPPMLFAAGMGESGLPAPTEEGIEWTTFVQEDGTGYVIEIKLPWSKNNVPAQSNAVIGFEVQINDADDIGSTRSGKLHWTDSPGDDAWHHAHQFGTVTLIGGGTATQAFPSIRRNPTGGVRIGQEVSFDATQSTAPGAIVSYEWDFGDGTTASGDVVTHSYAEIGEYTVTLEITDEGGVSGSSQQVIAVYTNVGTPEFPLEIPRASTAPVIDGVMDDVYSTAQVVQIANRANGSDPRDESDLSVTTYLLWDDDNLYALYDVTDDTLSNDSGNSWEDDTPEIYIDGGNQKNDTATGYDADDLQYEFGWGSTTPTGNSAGNIEGVIYAVVDKEDGTGYVLEAVVPWARASVTPTEGLEIGFELMINDDDSADDVVGGRQTKLSWFAPDGQDVAYNTPAAFGTARLVIELGSAAEGPRELPGGFAIESMYPNPFNPSTAAILTVDQPGEYAITVYNLLGQVVLRQDVTIQQVGQAVVPFDLRNQASGMYLFSFENKATGKMASSRAMLLK